MTFNLKRAGASLLSGLVFGLGLTISGMVDPAKVMNFLDVAGTWDPSLAFVMGSAVVVTFIGYRLAFAGGRPLFDTRFFVPAASAIDANLVAGAALFGIGWGLVGFCPGPAISSLALGGTGPYVFVAAMLAGLWAGRQVSKD